MGVVAFAGSARADYMDHFVIREDIGLRKAPYLGPSKTIVIPVQVAGHPPLDMAKLQHFFSAEDPNGFIQYYRTASLGRFQPEVTVAPLVKYDACPLPPESFPECKVKRGDISAFSAGMSMIRDVVKKADEAGVDFSQLDVNGRRGGPDEFVDGVMILANIPFGGIAFPFAYFNREDNLAGDTGGPLIVDGKKISHVAISGYSDEFVMIHEFGHLIGLTDLYDESQQYDGLHFSVMGAWGYDPKVPLPDAETRYRLRWADVVQVSGTGRHRVRPAETTGQVYRLGTGDEYFLVENRGPGGQFDGEFTRRGLVVYHVDRSVKLRGEEGRFVERLADCVNCDPWHPYIRVVQADGKFELQVGGEPDYENDLFRDGDSLGPDMARIPLSNMYAVQSTNLYSGEITNFGIRDIVVNEDDTIEVTFDAPVVDPCADVLCEEGDGCKPVNCGAPPPDEVTGCSCASAVQGAGWLFIVLVPLALRRR